VHIMPSPNQTMGVMSQGEVSGFESLLKGWLTLPANLFLKILSP
jgi:hypothetical protein